MLNNLKDRIIALDKKYILIFICILICTISILGISILNNSKNNLNAISCIKKENEYIIGGETVGIKLLASGVLVMGIDRDDTLLSIGDIILEVNGCKIETNKELEEYAKLGRKIQLLVDRNGENLNFEIEPKLDESSNTYKLGLWVKDSSAGVGTITFYEKNSKRFAALGHPITETQNMNILPITTGGITNTKIYMVKKGIAKVPGELKGTLTNETIGEIYTNTSNGIFGVMENDNIYNSNGIVQIGKKEEIQKGKAYIYATIQDSIKERYEIEILDVFLDSKDNKNISIKITDKRLIESTGGIVQGMSGAPIVQNGKLIGCITHVLLDNPQIGYGAFVENMIEDLNNI